jgi:putative transposase
VWEILHAAGIDPAPQRSGPTWRQFLNAQARTIIAADFLHVDCAVSLKRLYALIFIEHDTRRLHLAGIITHPTAQWTTQQARNLAMSLDRRIDSLRFLIRDRDRKYTDTFDAVFEADDIEVLLTPPRAPRANAICERVVGTLRREVVDRILLINQADAHTVLTEYTQHYNQHRPHQSRRQLPPNASRTPPPHPTDDLHTHRVRRKPVLGGLIYEYHQAA